MQTNIGSRIILTLAVLFAVAVGVAQRHSTLCAAFGGSGEINIVLLYPKGAAVSSWNTAGSMIKAFVFSNLRQKNYETPERRAADILDDSDVKNKADVFYVEMDEPLDKDSVRSFLNGWRSDPKVMIKAVKWAVERVRNGRTNLGAAGMFVAFSEYTKVNSSNFVVTECISRSAQEDAQVQQSPRVEIFNASGQNQLASRVSKYMRVAGFDVITASSYAKREAKTVIFSYGGTETAVRVRKTLGLEKCEIYEQPADKSVASAAVILGDDFNDGALR
jgi:hypothetical protein